MDETGQLTAKRWRQAKVIVADALEEHSPEARTALVARRCEGDSALRREVESLLAQTTSVFDQCAEEASAPLRRDVVLPTGRRVGAYAIVRELGRGGMGAVYLARRADGEFEKQVAVKVLKRGTDTDEVLRRFQAERQILARLEHPNIARLLDGGMTDDGLPYFVMEHVEGKPLTEFCREGAPSTEEQLRLFLKICAAVQFAHQNLIVHRDLKPGNILVTEDCEPKLLDFGIAKLLSPGDDALSVTMKEHQRLTPAYASPEQVRGESITTVSDIYTLGTLLYEILTGQNAHRFSTPHPQPTELLRVVAQEEPLRPSAAATDASIKRRLRGDLDTIILKALRKAPERRYDGVASFGEDIRRHLNGLPVRARKDTGAYRLSKFVQRHKLGVAAAATLALALIGGIAATTWEAQQARRQSVIAEERFRDVRELAHSVMFDYHDAIANLAGSTPIRKRMVEDSLKYLDKLAQQAGIDRSLQREIASGYLKIGDVQGRPNFANLGDTAGALASYRKALKLHEQLAAAKPGSTELNLELGETYTRIGDVLRNEGDLSGAVESNRKAAALMENLAAHSTSPQVREALALCYVMLGDVLGNPYLANLGDTNGALRSYRRALAIRQKIMADDPASVERRKWTAISHERVGNILQTINDTAGALENYRQALAIDDALLKEDSTNTFFQRQVGVDYLLLSMALVDAGDLNQARELQTKSIAIWEQMAKADPGNAVAQSDLSVGYLRLGAVLAKTRDTAGALNYDQKALAIIEALLAKDPKHVTLLMNQRGIYLRMADLFLTTGDLTGVLDYAGRELAIDDQILAINAASADARHNQAIAHAQLGKADTLLASNTQTPLTKQRQNWGAARSEYRKSLDIWQDMKAKGTLSGADAGKPGEVAQEIAHCDQALR